MLILYEVDRWKKRKLKYLKTTNVNPLFASSYSYKFIKA